MGSDFEMIKGGVMGEDKLEFPEKLYVRAGFKDMLDEKAPWEAEDDLEIATKCGWNNKPIAEYKLVRVGRTIVYNTPPKTIDWEVE